MADRQIFLASSVIDAANRPAEIVGDLVGASQQITFDRSGVSHSSPAWSEQRTALARVDAGVGEINRSSACLPRPGYRRYRVVALAAFAMAPFFASVTFGVPVSSDTRRAKSAAESCPLRGTPMATESSTM